MIDWWLDLHPYQTYPFLFAALAGCVLLSRGIRALEPNIEALKSGAVNIIHYNITGTLYAASVGVLVVVNAAYAKLGLPEVPLEFWQAQPFWVTALAVLLVYDFCYYWIHRLTHASRWLWPLHAVHHSERHMHFLSSLRGHFLEWLLIYAMLIVMMTWLGLSIVSVATIYLIRELSQFYTHSNINWNHGPLRYVIVSPRMHRWHHVDLPEAHDKNFATIFSFIDVLFGTYYNPRPSHDLPTGVPELPSNDLLKLLTHPFMEWGRLARETWGSKGTPDTARVSAD